MLFRSEMEKEKEKTAEMQNEIDEIKKKAENELSLAKQKKPCFPVHQLITIMI